MLPLPSRSTRTDTLFPDTTLFRSGISGFLTASWQGPAMAAGIGCDLVLTVLGQVARVKRARSARQLKQVRSEEHTSELQSLMRISYAVICLKKKIVYKDSTKHGETLRIHSIN